MKYIDYVSFDKPIIYKKLKLYPIKVKDYFQFSIYTMALTVDKNSIPDVKIISMGYLQYLLYLAEKDFINNPYIFWIDRLFSLCLPEDESFNNPEESIRRFLQNEKGKVSFIINGEMYTENDFQEIKKIICEQNLIELPDENISKDVRDSLEAAKRYKEKISGSGKTGSFEDYITSLAVTTGWSFEYIYELTIRKFINSVRRLDNLIHYKIYLGASMSGMVEFKDKSFIKHWLTDLSSEDKYSDVSMDLDVIQNKISMESAKQ